MGLIHGHGSIYGGLIHGNLHYRCLHHDLYEVDDSHHLKALVPQAIGKLLLLQYVGIRLQGQGDESKPRENLQRSDVFGRVMEEHKKVGLS